MGNPAIGLERTNCEFYSRHVLTCSKKGTFVNGKKVGSGNTVQLQHHDKITFLIEASEEDGKGKTEIVVVI